jgi:hypothetical protein
MGYALDAIAAGLADVVLTGLGRSGEIDLRGFQLCSVDPEPCPPSIGTEGPFHRGGRHPLISKNEAAERRGADLAGFLGYG